MKEQHLFQKKRQHSISMGTLTSKSLEMHKTCRNPTFQQVLQDACVTCVLVVSIKVVSTTYIGTMFQDITFLCMLREARTGEVPSVQPHLE